MTTLAEAHIQAEARLRAAATRGVRRAWQSLGGYDESDVPDFLRLALPLILTAQRSSATITNAYLARAGGRAPLPLDFAAVTGAGARAGTPPAEVYRRPFVTVWTALAAGTAYDAAVSAGLARATSTAAMDVQLAMRETMGAVAKADPRIVGYERIPDAGACELCVMASTQRYRVGDLMPIHNHCGCGVAPIYGDSDPGPTINADRLAEARESGAEPVVHEHGELGPVLGRAGDTFTQL